VWTMLDRLSTSSSASTTLLYAWSASLTTRIRAAGIADYTPSNTLCTW
jgi:hypothetical protein